ncbi:MAG: helicase-related protein, partial [Gemmataceae bacterium]
LSRTRRAELAGIFPERFLQTTPIELTRGEQELIEVVCRYLDTLRQFQQVSVLQAMMSSPRALLAQAENMVANHTLSPPALNEIRWQVESVPMPAKLTQLIRLLTRLRTENSAEWRAVVFTTRLETQLMIGEALDKVGITYGFIRGNAETANITTIAQYTAEPPGVRVIVATEAGAEGINLQSGNVLINYDLPWNPMVVEQRIGRVQRLGSKYAKVVVYNIVGRGTIEEQIVGRLTEKLHGIAQGMGEIEGILDLAGMDNDGDKSVEAQIRQMVVAAMTGRNMAKYQQQIERNITEAQQLFEKQRGELDTAFGSSTAAESLKPMPKLERRPPKMPYREFVRGARIAEGYIWKEIGSDIIELKAVGRVPEQICIAKNLPRQSDAVFAPHSMQHYAPGRPHFERLAQQWCDQHGHWV